MSQQAKGKRPLGDDDAAKLSIRAERERKRQALGNDEGQYRVGVQLQLLNQVGGLHSILPTTQSDKWVRDTGRNSAL